jgi:hypothetical protein
MGLCQRAAFRRRALCLWRSLSLHRAFAGSSCVLQRACTRRGISAALCPASLRRSLYTGCAIPEITLRVCWQRRMQDGREMVLGAGCSPLAMCVVQSCVLTATPAAHAGKRHDGDRQAAATTHRLLVASCNPHLPVWSLVRARSVRAVRSCVSSCPLRCVLCLLLPCS